jgi:hypothetical protein
MKSISFKALCPVIISLLLASTGCFPGKRIFEDSNKPSKVVTSTDGVSQISIPASWSVDNQLKKDAELQVSDRVEEMYVIVLSESKSDFPANVTLDNHAELTRGIVVGNLTSPQSTTPVRMTINGNQAVQNEIRGTMNNVNLVYLHTTVETPKYFHQIVAWTLPSRYDKNRPKLLEVIQSFKETSPGAAAR